MDPKNNNTVKPAKSSSNNSTDNTITDNSKPKSTSDSHCRLFGCLFGPIINSLNNLNNTKTISIPENQFIHEYPFF